jgi:transcriptional regulator with XRE-family HTH domain
MADALTKALRKYLKTSGRTQRELALAVGVSEPMLSLVLKGWRTPSLIVAMRLSEETGIPVEAFARKTG